MTTTYYLLTDWNDKDREDAIINIFKNEQDAKDYAAELGAGDVEEFEGSITELFIDHPVVEEHFNDGKLAFQKL